MDAKQSANRESALSDTELALWLRLLQLPRFGAVALSKLRNSTHFKLTDLNHMDRASLLQIGFTPAQADKWLKPAQKLIQSSLDWVAQHHSHSVISLDCSNYPAMLAQISSAPLLLFVQGNQAILHQPQIAMVGSRNPGLQGKQLARKIAADLTHSGWKITSGLALGIDGCAHQGCLDVNGETVAVLGTAINQVYPRRHAKLAEQILANQGCILSEFAPGMPSLAENFPRRNRIISGLTYGTLVVEAAIKSGSLITAKYALEQNRDVYAVPGNVNNPMSAGCHHLIKQGAKLVESAEDINSEYSHLDFIQSSSSQKNLQKNSLENLATDQLLDSVEYEVTSLDLVAQRCNLPVNEVLAKLLEYELRGIVASVPGGYVKLGAK